MIPAVWRARAYGLETTRAGSCRSRTHRATARAWSHPRAVSGTEGVAVNIWSRLPSLSAWRIRSSWPTRSALAIHAVDELAEPAGPTLHQAAHEAQQVVELGLLLALGGQRGRLHQLARDE